VKVKYFCARPLKSRISGFLTGNNITQSVRKGEELDWDALHKHLQDSIGNLAGKPEISQFHGGNSNLTYRLKYDNHDLVIRRPPFGTKAKSAHSMIREYRIMNTLKPVYPSVPDTLYYSDDESIIGAEFYVMRKVEGTVIRDVIPPQWHYTAKDTRRFCFAFWEKLIELHEVDYRAAGLGDFGKPEAYSERQILGWNSRYERAITPDVSKFDDVRKWLEEHIPPDSGRQSVLHGDYRIDNVILDKDDPCKILAVLDWEICALGDPLMDLGNALAYWTQADDPDYLKALILQPSGAPGMLTRREILDFYQQSTGIDTSDFCFYQVYGYWRNAVILQQIYYRYFHAQTQDQRFRYFGRAVQSLGEHCQRILRPLSG
jgi:aminoglycoside phosphotransferase (APT) family kinase protein